MYSQYLVSQGYITHDRDLGHMRTIIIKSFARGDNIAVEGLGGRSSEVRSHHNGGRFLTNVKQ